MGEPDGAGRSRAGRPRLAADDAILSATREELRESGLQGLSVEAVAKRAKVSPGTVYRRWPSKTALAVAAYSDTIGRAEPIDTGSLRSDLEALVPELHRFFTGEHGAMLVSLLTAAGADDAVLLAVRDAAGIRRAGLRRILERAEQRGELKPDVDRELVMDLIVGPLWTRLLVTGHRVTRPLVRRILDLAVDAAAEPLTRDRRAASP